MQKFKLILLILIGTLCWSMTMVKSGIVHDYGMGFWGANGHDGIWHMALIESLSRGSSEMPIMAGVQIKNYHLGFDLFAAGIHVLTHLSVSVLYFQILPPIFAILIGFLTYQLTKSLWATFFVYFGGNWAWLLGKGESAFWSQQAISTLINPPFAMSLIFLLLLMILLKKDKYIFAGFVLFLLPHIKIYAGLLAFGGLALAGLKNKKYYIPLLIGLILYFISNSQLTTYGRQLIWQPGWFLETLMGDRLNWPRYYSAMTTYRLSDNLVKGIPAYTIAFLIFWFGNMGTRAIKELFILKKIKHFGSLSPEDIFIWSIICAGGLIPMLFLQSGTSWNSIQFFYYSLFFSSILAGKSTDKWANNKVVALLIVLLTIPTTFMSLRDVYLPSRPPAAISKSELEALALLKNMPPGTVLTPLANVDPYAQAPRALYNYDSTAYVSALSAHPTYLEDEVNLSITGYDFSERKKEVQDYFLDPNSARSREFLVKNHIKYVYNPHDAIVSVHTVE